MPLSADLKSLKRVHPEYVERLPVWQVIDDLRGGLPSLQPKVNQYLPRRPTETASEYALRVKKLVFTPVMATALREFSVKLSSAPLSIGNVTLDDFWAQWSDNTDGDRNDVTQLVQDIFLTMLYYGGAFVAVDRPGDVRSRAEAELDENLPRAIVYRPTSVLNYGDTAEGGKWYLTVQDRTESQPLAEHVTRRRWTVWGDRSVDSYEADIKLGLYGDITSIKAPGATEWQAALDEYQVQGEARPHDLGRSPMSFIQLPLELHTARQAYPLQIALFIIENAALDAGSIAGSIQRVFTPADPVPTADHRVSYDEPDYAKDLRVGNDYILIAKSFAFVESTGAAIASLTSQRETLEKAVKNVASLGYTTSSTKGSLEQSGLSKSIDRDLMAATMKTFGRLCATLIENILQNVSAYAGRNERPQVTGLDLYDVQGAETVLAQSEQLSKVARAFPVAVLRLWHEKAASALLGHIGPVDADVIAAEFAAMPDSAFLPLPPEPPSVPFASK